VLPAQFRLQRLHRSAQPAQTGLFDGTGISRSMVQTCNLRGEVLRLVEQDRPAALRLFKGS
jgi:hypothetical protein